MGFSGLETYLLGVNPMLPRGVDWVATQRRYVAYWGRFVSCHVVYYIEVMRSMLHVGVTVCNR